jgi:hypothetical protein
MTINEYMSKMEGAGLSSRSSKLPTIEAFMRRMPYILLNNRYTAKFSGGKFWPAYSDIIDYMICSISLPPGEAEGECYGMGWFYTAENGKTKICHTGLVENYVAYMYIYPDDDKAGIVLVSMNDYLVGNMYLNNVIAPLTGEGLPDRSVMYLVLHGVIDLACIMLLAVAIYPAVTIKKWKAKKKSVVFEIFRHLVFPAGLLTGMNCLAPLFVIWLFAKDIWFVTVICAGLLLLGGLYKLGIVIRTKQKG